MRVVAANTYGTIQAAEGSRMGSGFGAHVEYDSANAGYPYLQFMRKAAAHAVGHGATSKPLLAPLDATVLRGQVPLVDLQREGIRVMPWTTNAPEVIRAIVRLGVDGLISDRPDLVQIVLSDERAAPAGDAARLRHFEVSGHRGARGLRPENTLPAFEAALDCLVDTIETDIGITSDGRPLIWHDPYVCAENCGSVGGSWDRGNRIYIRDLTFGKAQRSFLFDKLRFGPSQTNDLSHSPVSVAFAEEQQLISPYVPIDVGQLFQFTSFYANYYANGPGKLATDAAERAAAARQVGFNLEAKILPDNMAAIAENHPAVTIPADMLEIRTVPLPRFVQCLCSAIDRNSMCARARVLSFDFRLLLLVQEHYSHIETCYLTGDPAMLSTEFVPQCLRAG